MAFQKRENVRWGIIGCGGIAHAFADAIALVSDAELVAGASRTPGRAAEFAAEYPPMRAYTDYESLVSDPDIDAIYVSTTHNFHHENVTLALNAGKHVLCEKPITINAEQLERLISIAREKDLFLMEAVWTRFLPGIAKVKEILSSGVIGDPNLVSAVFGIDRDTDPEHRLLNPDLAGGALLDLGIYPLTFAHLVFDSLPEQTASLAYLGPTGVDESSGYLLRFPGGKMAVLASTCKQRQSEEASIYGKQGVIRVDNFYHPSFIHVEVGDDRKTYDVRYPSSGFQYEIQEATTCILEGKRASDVLPPEESLRMMRLMDSFRESWGFRYPEER